MINVISIIRDEAPYLEEWLEWNLLQGVDHFYIYDNNSVDGTREILERYSGLGLVTIKTWPRFPGDVSTQLMMYRDFLKRHPHMLDWCCFIDSDEFFYFNEAETLKDWLEKHLPLLNPPRYLAGVLVPWMLYGNNGHEEYEPGFIVERFTKRQKLLNNHIKSILIPARIQSQGNDAHAFKVKPGFQLINVWGENVPDMTPVFFDRELTVNVLRLNHYHTKSTAEYKKRCARGRIDMNVARDFDENFPIHNKNEVEDLSPLVYIPKVKQVLESRPWSVK